MFVAGLAAFTTTAYAVFCNRAYAPLADAGPRATVLQGAGLFACAGTLFTGNACRRHSRYLRCLSGHGRDGMCYHTRQRHDLSVPALLGGCLSAATYFLLCLAADALMPGLFKNIWHTDKFLNIFIAGVPVEELLYGFTAGLYRHKLSIPTYLEGALSSAQPMRLI